jgi:polysaccharide pyruvyl transferase WcaK-like protein
MMDMDFVLEAWTSALVRRAHTMWMLGAGRRWQPGQPLKLLLATYNGERNTGSDVRVEEIVRQIRTVLGENNVTISVMTQNFELTKGYFEGAQQVHLPDIFPPFLYSEVRKYDGVIACEGSMFKSKFSNALTTMFIGALGIASSENKVSIGYGGEAGAMDPGLAKMCARYVRRSLVITRNEESQAVLSKLGIPTELGTDTAWTFEPLPPEYGRKALLECGWDGRKPVLALCPINPFWWPVKPSVLKFLGRTIFGAYKTSQYRSIYFHKSGPEVDAAYAKYLSAMAGAANAFRAKHDVFPVLIAMERLDARACAALAPQMGGVPVLTSETYNMYQMVSILRCCTLMVSSRFHAMVTSMPAGVASAGVTMDERIRNLLRERGHEHLLLTVDDPDLEAKLIVVMERLAAEADSIRDGIESTVVRNLKTMARMGLYLEGAVHECYPEFPVRDGVHHWKEYLPPLSDNLERLIENYDTAKAVAAGD